MYTILLCTLLLGFVPCKQLVVTYLVPVLKLPFRSLRYLLNLSVAHKFFILGGKRRLRYQIYACGKNLIRASILNKMLSFRMKTNWAALLYLILIIAKNWKKMVR